LLYKNALLLIYVILTELSGASLRNVVIPARTLFLKPLDEKYCKLGRNGYTKGELEEHAKQLPLNGINGNVTIPFYLEDENVQEKDEKPSTFFLCKIPRCGRYHQLKKSKRFLDVRKQTLQIQLSFTQVNILPETT
jgi:hypothetical protein